MIASADRPITQADLDLVADAHVFAGLEAGDADEPEWERRFNLYCSRLAMVAIGALGGMLLCLAVL